MSVPPWSLTQLATLLYAWFRVFPDVGATSTTILAEQEANEGWATTAHGKDVSSLTLLHSRCPLDHQINIASGATNLDGRFWFPPVQKQSKKAICFCNPVDVVFARPINTHGAVSVRRPNQSQAILQAKLRKAASRIGLCMTFRLHTADRKGRTDCSNSILHSGSRRLPYRILLRMVSFM